MTMPFTLHLPPNHEGTSKFINNKIYHYWEIVKMPENMPR